MKQNNGLKARKFQVNNKEIDRNRPALNGAPKVSRNFIILPLNTV